jgi:hypothetical protein
LKSSVINGVPPAQVGVGVAVGVDVAVAVGVGDGVVAVTVAHPISFPEFGSLIPAGGAIEAQFVPVAVTVTVTSKA